jgi:GNAT superfamily N-acetyltransferase
MAVRQLRTIDPQLELMLPRAAELLEAGVLYEDRHPFAASTREDPVIGSSDLYVAWCHPKLLADLDRFLVALGETWPDVSRILLRGDPDQVPADGAPYIAYLSKKPGDAPWTSSLEIRDVFSNQDWAFVRWALATALENGYSASGYSPDSVTVAEYVAEAFDPERTPGLRALIALEDGQPLGHATWIEDQFDEVSGRVFDELVDMLTVDQAAGRGISRLLLSAVESRVSARGADLLGNVIAEKEESHWRSVVGNLKATGWTEEYTIYAFQR